MDKLRSLAELLGTPSDDMFAATRELDPKLLTAKGFADAILASPEFHQYILNSLTQGTIAPAVLCRLMDYGWGKPPDRVEHTGKDGQPIETVTEVRRILVRAGDAERDLEQPPADPAPYTTH